MAPLHDELHQLAARYLSAEAEEAPPPPALGDRCPSLLEQAMAGGGELSQLEDSLYAHRARWAQHAAAHL